MGRAENDVTDERIVHILNEASQMMKPNQQQDETQSNDDSTSPNQLNVNLNYIILIFIIILNILIYSEYLTVQTKIQRRLTTRTSG